MNRAGNVDKMPLFVFGVFVLMALMPEVSSAFTAPTASFTAACDKVTGFFGSFETILRVASVSIVTIAVIFAGYQIAFAHKRLSDVAPVLMGGLLIGGAATIAAWFVGDLNQPGAVSATGATDKCK